MIDNLYANIGGKIKGWAKWIFIIEAIGAIIGAFVMMGNDDALTGMLLLIAGPFAALVSTWLLYAFGELVEDVHYLRKEKEGKLLPVLGASANANSSAPTVQPTIIPTAPQTFNDEEDLKAYIEKALEEKSKPQELLDLYWQFKKYTYGFYDAEETQRALAQVIAKCENDPCEGNAKLMRSLARRKLGLEEQCALCGEFFPTLTTCAIRDDLGTRYRDICDGCMAKYGATPQ